MLGKAAKTRAAVFGGTFDPPHQGHVRLAAAVLERRRADKVIFVPAASPPHKPGTPITAFHHRLAMLELALEGFEGKIVSDLEFRRFPEPSYTIVTMRALARLYPDFELALLIGGDSLRSLHTWREAEALARDFAVISYPRPGESPRPGELLAHWPPDLAAKLEASLLEAPTFDISATSLRDALRARRDTGGRLAPKVLDYIEINGLYR